MQTRRILLQNRLIQLQNRRIQLQNRRIQLQTGRIQLQYRRIQLQTGRIQSQRRRIQLQKPVIIFSHCYTVLYSRDHGGLDFSGHKYHPKPASQYHSVALVVLVRYNQARKCLRYDPKCFQ